MGKIILTALVGVLVVSAAFSKGSLRENLGIIAQYRFRHIAASLVLIAAVGAVSWGLWTAAPVFRLNPILWVVAKVFHAGTGQGQGNLIFSGLSWKWYAVVFLPVLALALPRLARVEEEKYRAGTRSWWPDGILRSLRFGLVHMIMFIPFSASLALSLAGLWFTSRYFKGGTDSSTLYHAAFNTVIVAVLFAIVVATWVFPS